MIKAYYFFMRDFPEHQWDQGHINLPSEGDEYSLCGIVTVSKYVPSVRRQSDSAYVIECKFLLVVAASPNFY